MPLSSTKKYGMKRREVTATGTVNNNGGLAMYMGELNAFFAEHKGERIIARFIAAPVASSEALKGYYFNYVVPTVQQGLRNTGDRKTEKQTEYYLRTLSPVCYEETANIDTGEYEQRLREIRELDNAELIDHIETIRQFAAENLAVFIDDPKTL